MKNPPVLDSLTVDPVTLQCHLERETIRLVDVREPGEYAQEHIAGAHSLPLSQINARLNQLNLDLPIVLYCQTGRRSGLALQQLQQAGVPQVSHLNGGLNEWKRAGLSTRVDPKAPISLMRQVQIVAGGLVLLGVILGSTVSPLFYGLSGFVGAGLMFAGITNTCALGMVLAKLPYNQQPSSNPVPTARP